MPSGALWRLEDVSVGPISMRGEAATHNPLFLQNTIDSVSCSLGHKTAALAERMGQGASQIFTTGASSEPPEPDLDPSPARTAPPTKFRRNPAAREFW